MALSKFTGETNNIQSLPDQPTETAMELKAKFDKTGAELKDYINNTLTEEIDTELGNKADSNNVYKKEEVDELTNGIILNENNEGAMRNHLILRDFVQNYKCIDLIFKDGTVKRIFNTENKTNFDINICYVKENASYQALVLSKLKLNFSHKDVGLKTSESYNIMFEIKDEGIEVNEYPVSLYIEDECSFRRIIGYK